MIDLYLFRHAESEMNFRVEEVGGRSNWAKLTDAGVEQSVSLGKRLKEKDINFDFVYTSPAVRTIDTAKIACKELGLGEDKIIVSDLIQEISQGEWEGKLRKDCYTPEIMTELDRQGWDFKAPGGESRKEVEDRVVKFLNEEILPKYNEGESCSIAVFSHGVAIKCLIRHILDFDQDMTYKVLLNNTSISQLSYTPRGWFILRINDGAHINKNSADIAYQNWIYGVNH
jgi:broad specificity phosphatase PhoE